MIPVSARYSKTEPLERFDIAILERLSKNARGKVLVIVTGINIAASAVLNSVENANSITQSTVEEVTLNLYADIAIWRQLAGICSLDKEQIRTRLKTLQTDGFLEFSSLNLKLR